MGVGRGSGDNKLDDAVSNAINSPLLETKISGARAVLINITGGSGLTMYDVDRVASRIEEEADDNAIIILGTSIKEEMQDEIAITVIAAGFEKTPAGKDFRNDPVPVVPNIRDTMELDEEPKPIEPSKNTAQYDGIPGIDIPDFLKR